MPTASRATTLIETHAVDLILTGHNHDLFVNFDGRSAMVESGYDAHYVTLIDVTIEVNRQNGTPRRSPGGRNSASSTPRR